MGITDKGQGVEIGPSDWPVIRTRRERKTKPFAVPWSATRPCARFFLFPHNSNYRLAQRQALCPMYEQNVSFSPLRRNRNLASSVEWIGHGLKGVRP